MRARLCVRSCAPASVRARLCVPACACACACDCAYARAIVCAPGGVGPQRIEPDKESTACVSRDAHACEADWQELLSAALSWGWLPGADYHSDGRERGFGRGRLLSGISPSSLGQLPRGVRCLGRAPPSAGIWARMHTRAPRAGSRALVSLARAAACAWLLLSTATYCLQRGCCLCQAAAPVYRHIRAELAYRAQSRTTTQPCRKTCSTPPGERAGRACSQSQRGRFF